MKSIVINIILIFLVSIVAAQEAEKPRVPYFIVFNKFTNKESFKLIRWVNWTDDQKLKIFLYAKEFGDQEQKIPEEVAIEINTIKNSLNTPEKKNEFDEQKKTEELTKIALEKHLANAISKIQSFMETLQTEDQKKEYNEKIKNANLAKIAMQKNLEEFDKKTIELKGVPFNQNLYDVMNTTKFFYFPETWALTRTPLSNEETNQLMELIKYLSQVEQGFFLAIEMGKEDLNQNYNLFDFNLKKDFGTEALLKEVKKFSKPTQEIFTNLLNHYVSQKKAILAIYTKYGDHTKLLIPIVPPKIVDAP